MKVLVFGNSGSARSTYARALTGAGGLGYLDLDSIVREPGWIAAQRATESMAMQTRRMDTRLQALELTEES